MHPAPARHRRDDRDRGDLVRRAGHGIALEHDQVGRVAGQQPPEAPLGVAGVGGAAPEAVERELDRERLGDRPVAGRGGLDAGQRVERLDRRVGAEAERRAARGQRAERVGARAAIAPDAPGPAGGRRVRARAAWTRSRRARRSGRGRPDGGAAHARCAGRRPRGAQRSRVAASASSTARLAASPIACTARSRPASAQRPGQRRAAPRRPAAARRARRRRTARASRPCASRACRRRTP